MSEISEEERQRRSVVTKENRWIKLARAGQRGNRQEIWNSFMLRCFGAEGWPEDLLNRTKVMEDAEYIEWYKLLDINPNKLTFTLDFKDLYFTGEVEFSGFFFPFGINADFSGTVFCEEVNFGGTIFRGLANFSKVNFKETAVFTDVFFYGRAIFKDATFVQAVFIRADFTRGSDFSFTTFLPESEYQTGFAFFSEAKFHNANFRNAKFYSKTMFIGASEAVRINFKGASFTKPPHFESFQCESIFFDSDPQKFGNDFHQNYLHESASAWAALIRLMERVHNLPMRQIFHEKLLEVEKEFESEKDARWLYSIFQALGSGRTIKHALGAWVYTAFLFQAFYSIIAAYNQYSPSYTEITAYTMKRGLPFLITHTNGLDEAIGGSVLVLFASTLHMLLSLVYVFMIGLALRNRFKMR